MPTDGLSRHCHFVFMDIIGFSKTPLTAEHQVIKLEALNSMIKESKVFSDYSLKDLVILPTGDGMAIGFPKSCEEPMILASDLHKALKNYNNNKEKIDQIHLRIGLHSGAVFDVKDIHGNDNVTGPGIIRARRVMDIGDSDHILASSSIAEELKKLRTNYSSKIKALGPYETKHEESIIIYNIFDEEIGNKQVPKSHISSSAPTTFKFLHAKVKLMLLDPESMLIKHEYYKKLQNLSNNTVDRHVTVISGDKGKKIEELNLKVFDISQNELDIDVSVEQPLTKEFSVLFGSPIRKEEIYEYTQIWDWEEPEKNWRHEFVNESNLFEFEFNYKKSMGDFELKCYERNAETGLESISSIKPLKTENGDLVTISWSDTDIGLNKILRFEW